MIESWSDLFWSILPIATFVGGMEFHRALSRQRVIKAERDVLDLLHARHSIELSPEDAIRRGGA